MSLTFAEANQVIRGTMEKAEELGIKVNVAACDAGGRLIAFGRMDGATWAGAYGGEVRRGSNVGLKFNGSDGVMIDLSQFGWVGTGE